MGVALGAALPAGRAAAATPGLVQPGWRLRWAPQAAVDGLAAFEHVEDDRANSNPARAPHITVDGDAYRFSMYLEDRDTSTDRQRQEVRGMRVGPRTVSMLNGETWRFTYSMFIPDTLKATTTFSHIMQMKMPGTGSDPIVVQSLRRASGRQTLELRVFATNTLVGNVDLVPLQNHFIDIEFIIGIGAAPDGWVRWAVRDGGTTLIDTVTTGVTTSLGDRVRPKWGIYRSLRDTSGSLADTYLRITNLRGYKWVEGADQRRWARYPIEQATIQGGTVESGLDGPNPTTFASFPDEAGGFVEWRVFARSAGPAVLNLWYANATPVVRPMDVAVNGVPVASGLAFANTPAWSDWETRTLLVDLRAGLNTVRATAVTAAGAPHVQSLEVDQPSS
jgi:hypothetical protein